MHIKNEKSNNSYHDFGWIYFVWRLEFCLEIPIVLLVVVAATAAAEKVSTFLDKIFLDFFTFQHNFSSPQIKGN